MFKVLIPNSSQNSSVEGETGKNEKQEAPGIFIPGLILNNQVCIFTATVVALTVVPEK